MPTLWIANAIKDMDPAYLRRFDLVIEMPVPPQSVRARIAGQAFKGLGVSETFVHALARQSALAPAHLTRAARVARLCKTDKTTGPEREAQLARRLDQPLLIKRASDLLGSLVGQTEQAINAMFAEARHDQAVLLLDEADSFLRSRASAHQSWEVTQVNELLTQMEAFDGVFICTTNLVDQLDAASLRRFDLKVKFAALTAEQRLRLFTQVLSEQGVSAPDESPWSAQLASLDDLTPGDFAAVIRQLRIEQAEWTAARLFERLQAECRHKRQGRGRPIGFAASL